MGIRAVRVGKLADLGGAGFHVELLADNSRARSLARR